MRCLGGDTALHNAARKGRHLVVKLLLQRKADIKLQDDEGRSALHLAAANGHYAVGELLLQHGANIEEKDKNCPGAQDIDGNPKKINERLKSMETRRDSSTCQATPRYMLRRARAAAELSSCCWSRMPMFSRRTPKAMRTTEWHSSPGKAPAALADEGGHQDIAALLRLAAFQRHLLADETRTICKGPSSKKAHGLQYSCLVRVFSEGIATHTQNLEDLQ